jgi:DNA-binding NtrC family response regulator
MAQVCVIDDKEMLRDSLTAALVREEHAVTSFADPVEALAEIKRDRFDLVLTDLKMPRLDGLSLLREIRTAGCDVPVVVMTAFASVPTAVEAMKLGAFDYLPKPFDADSVSVVVERAVEFARLRRENEALRVTVHDLHRRRELVGRSPAMTALREEIHRVASGHATVLITGESGTGKELVAAAIHQASPRSDRPMLCLNCAALSATLLESELFGHDRGAFTGADRTRKGRFELADGGTLLLDEISEMAVPLQAKLLRVLQEGEFERVGSSTTRRADVRVIATTNRNLEEWVARNRFREDLYYRLNVLPIQVPPLSSRREDIPELLSCFLQRATSEEGLLPLQLDPEAERLLMEYDWPGNVRELENIARRAATLCRGGALTAALVEPWLRPVSKPANGIGPLREGFMLEDMERQLIEQTLARFNGHRARSAKALGMGVRTLGMKLKQWRQDTAPAEGVRTERLLEAGTRNLR